MMKVVNRDGFSVNTDVDGTYADILVATKGALSLVDSTAITMSFENGMGAQYPGVLGEIEFLGNSLAPYPVIMPYASITGLAVNPDNQTGGGGIVFNLSEYLADLVPRFGVISTGYEYGPHFFLDGDVHVGQRVETYYNNISSNGILSIVCDASAFSGSKQIAVNVGNTDATELNGQRNGGWHRSPSLKPVFTREDHGQLDNTGFFTVVGNKDIGAGVYGRFIGTGYVYVEFGRNVPGYPFGDGPDNSGESRYSTHFDFDTRTAGSTGVALFNTRGNKCFFNQDTDGSFCVSCNTDSVSSGGLFFINNLGFPVVVGYSIKYMETGDPYTYYGWLYD